MPKPTFMNIDPVKRERIVETGAELFAAMDYEQVDVKTVVVKAGLPRGSFYAYFDDMEDYYCTVMETVQKERLDAIGNAASGFFGTVFDFLVRMFAADMRDGNGSRNALLRQRYFRYIQTQRAGSLRDTPYHPDQRDNVFRILVSNGIGFGTAPLSPEEHRSLFELCMIVYLATYNEAVREGLPVADGTRLFERRIRIIERGVQS